jgi:uncharacterized protein (TIGR03067 family)
MRRRALTVLVIGWLVAAGGLVATAGTPADQAVKQDRKEYQGTWRVVSLEADGHKMPEADSWEITVTNGPDGTWVVRFVGEEIAKGTSTIDPMKQPKAVDFTQVDEDNRKTTYLGIYAIRGDCRKLCYALPGLGRPTEFSARPGSGYVLVVFRREKK